MYKQTSYKYNVDGGSGLILWLIILSNGPDSIMFAHIQPYMYATVAWLCNKSDTIPEGTVLHACNLDNGI